MSSPILSVCRTAYPDYNVAIDRSNQLGRTITNLIRFGVVNRDIVTNQPVTYGAGGTVEASQYGKVLNGTGSSAARASVFLDLSAYDKLTVSFSMYWDSYADNDNLAMEFSSISTPGFTIDPNNSSPSGTFSFLTRSAGSAVYKNARFVRPSGGWHHYVFTFDRTASAGNLGLTLSIDGVRQSLTTVDSSALTGNFASATLHLLSRSGTSLRGVGKLSDIVIRGGTILSADEAAQEYRNPWQIFQPIPRRIFAVSAAGGASVTADGSLPSVSLTAAAGSATGAATASGSIAASSLTAPTGSATGSATTSGSLQAISLSAPTGSAATAGSAAADGSLAVIWLTSPDATATVSIQAQAALAAIFLTPAEGSATGSAVCSGDFAPISLTACRASASNGLESAEALRKSVFLKTYHPSYVIRV